MAAALYKSEEYSVARLAELTRIDPWFLSKMNNIVNMIKTLETVDYKVQGVNARMLCDQLEAAVSLVLSLY